MLPSAPLFEFGKAIGSITFAGVCCMPEVITVTPIAAGIIEGEKPEAEKRKEALIAGIARRWF